MTVSNRGLAGRAFGGDGPCDPARTAVQRSFDLKALISNRWILSVIAVLPICWLLACYRAGAPEGAEPAGFIQYDQAYYMAEARGHFDRGFHLLYGLPASPDYDTPRVYFRPQTVVLGALVKFTGLPPGSIYMAFGVVATLIFFRRAIALDEAVIGLASRGQYIVLPLFLWGGGLAVLHGLALKLTKGGALFTFDTLSWGANLGRGVIYGVEGYYHALFFAAVLALLRRWYATALLLTTLTSLSHPFTGTELLFILTGWVLLEHLLDRPAAPPLWFSGGVVALLGLHLTYWLVALSWLSPEHAALAPTWQLPWVLHGTMKFRNTRLWRSPLCGSCAIVRAYQQPWRTAPSACCWLGSSPRLRWPTTIC
jgi:hypothetical protein